MTAVLPSVATDRVRYHFLDGIRGLAALYVLIFHSIKIDLPQQETSLSPAMRTLSAVFGYGHFAVAIFIVLSGFSLMLPLARNSTLQLRSGFWPYLWRRCRRVLPPYYAALILSIVAILAAGLVPGASTTARDEALTAGSIGSHLLLVHNWNADWVFRINGPMWSVATEFQIYFLFPLALLPMWRRLGAAPTIAITWGTAFVIHFVLPDDANFAWAAPWFVGSFAMGMWASTVGVAGGRSHRLLHRVPWGWVTLGSLAFLVALLAQNATRVPLPFLDLLVSIGGVAWILACMARVGQQRAVMNEVLGSRPLVALGAFSYSLYLLQHPLLRFSEAILGELPIGFETALWVQLVIGTPLIMIASRVFAEFFELPFTTGSSLMQAVKRKSPFRTISTKGRA